MKAPIIKSIFLTPILLLFAGQVNAAEFTVRPFLIDEQLPPAAIEQKTVRLTNDSTYRKYVVYATVNEISVDNEGEIKEFVTPSVSDRTDTITSWIELGRGRIEIPPGESIEVPLTLRINSRAQPGEYHAFLGFVPAPNRPKAEEIAMQGEADGIILKITITDERKDSIKINEFSIDRFVLSDKDRSIDILVENMGDLPAVPVGEIIFYNSRGQEVDAVSVNDEEVSVDPGETAALTAVVPMKSTLSRFKANLSLRYGLKQPGVIYDTTTFYMVSLPLLLLLFGGILLVVLLFTVLLHRAVRDDAPHDGDDVLLFVKEGHDADPLDHDIDLKNKN